MHYYQHHIGDFLSATSRLKDSQCMAYLRLMWMYYDTEMPLENNPRKLAFQIGADAGDVELILEFYFYLDGDVWRHKRCDEELDAFYKKSAAASEKAKKRWEKNKNNAPDMQQQCRGNATASKNDATHIPIYPYTQEEPIERGSKILTGVSANEKSGNPDADTSPSLVQPPPVSSQKLTQTRISQLFQPTEAAVRLAQKHGLDIGTEADLFVAHYESTGEFRVDWQACFRKWLVRSGQRKAETEKCAQGPPDNGNRFKKFNALDVINGGDGYGNKRESERGRIIDVGGGVAEEGQPIQRFIPD